MQESIIWFLFEYGLCAIEILFFYDFLSLILGRKKKISRFIFYMTGVSLSLVILMLTKIALYSNINSIIGFILLILTSIFVFRGNIKQKIFYVAVFYVCVIVSDVVSVNIVGILVKKSIVEIVMNQTWVRIVFSCASKLFLFILLKLIEHSNKNINQRIPKTHWYLILIIYLISVVSMLSLTDLSILQGDVANKAIYIVIVAFGLLIINIIIYYVFLRLSQYYEREEEYHIIELKNEMTEKYILEKERAYQEVRKFRHDFHNHINCISALLNNHDVESALEYIAHLEQEVQKLPIWIKSGNKVTDALFNQKKMEAAHHHIGFHVQGTIPPRFQVKPIDLCAILGNALDNAIEASIKIKQKEKRKIDVIIKPYKDYLFMELSNSIAFNPLSKSRGLQTTKKDKKNHGLGMMSIKSSVEKYNGFLEYKCEEEKFILSIMIPMEEAKEEEKFTFLRS